MRWRYPARIGLRAGRYCSSPGPTLGNFTGEEAVRILLGMRQTMAPRGLALIGIDMDKSPALLEAAYNDAASVTAAFTLNLLERLNREIGAHFDPTRFQHCTRYHSGRRRIETTLVSGMARQVQLDGQTFQFSAGEAMQVEYSHKYRDENFVALAADAGLLLCAQWTSDDPAFGLRLLRANWPLLRDAQLSSLAIVSMEFR